MECESCGGPGGRRIHGGHFCAACLASGEISAKALCNRQAETKRVLKVRVIASRRAGKASRIALNKERFK